MSERRKPSVFEFQKIKKKDKADQTVELVKITEDINLGYCFRTVLNCIKIRKPIKLYLSVKTI